MTDEVPLSFRMSEKANDREINEWYNKKRQVDRLEYIGESNGKRNSAKRLNKRSSL